MINVLADKARYLKFLLNENSTTILTGVGIAGTVTTAYLTGSASFKAARLLDQAKEESLDNDNVAVLHELTPAAKVKVVWRLYVAPITVGLISVASIILAHKISAKRIAALTIAAGISDRALHEYKTKVVERFGETKTRNIHDEIAQDRVSGQPLTREVLAVGTGEVLCYDMHTGRYFTSTVEDIKRAENKLNHELLNHMYASLTEFYDIIGLPPTSYSDNVGWNMNNQVEVVFSTVMSPDQRPCIAIDFRLPPTGDYNHPLHG